MTEDLETMAIFMGVKIPTEKEKKRSMPRGTLTSGYWNMQFQRVVELVDDWGYEVELHPGARDRVELGESKTIYINSSYHPETKFYTLLHEVGHILIRRNWRKFAMNYPNYLDGPETAVDGRRERRKSYRIGLIAEEIEAWKRGRAYAERHGLYVDMFKYDSDANTALMTYIDWIASISRTQAKAGRKAAKVRKARKRTAKK